MPYESEGHILNMRTAESQTITAGLVLELKADGDVGVSTASSATILGVALTDVTTTAADQRYPIAVVTKGLCEVTCRTAVNEGNLVTARGTGGSVGVTVGGTVTCILGRAITAGAAGEAIDVLL